MRFAYEYHIFHLLVTKISLNKTFTDQGTVLLKKTFTDQGTVLLKKTFTDQGTVLLKKTFTDQGTVLLKHLRKKLFWILLTLKKRIKPVKANKSFQNNKKYL